ncbi:MAG TPA: heterodisulfide reductase-related iron-sulfur binding cluster [Planctomycetota bacterium]|nr:heterodisulfide reductase-related iron-sulfur binding cluster [Planctomycetota bacterium]
MSTEGSPISYAPTDGLSYDPEDEVYWQAGKLRGEIERVFDICHGCRMCFKYCDSFPILFDLVDDEAHGQDVRKLSEPEVERVVDACFQCKLCDVQCPYTPRDNHEFQLDFPKLVHRIKAVRAKQRGLKLGERILADPDLAGRAARASFGMANALNRVALHRWFLEKVLGVHRDKLLPEFAGTTFERWAQAQGRTDKPAGTETVLFQTCYVQNNEPQIGRDTLEVLDRNGVDCACVKGLECCGMPAWEKGDLETLRKHARHNLERLMPHVDAGAKVLAINPTCSMMMRREYPELVASEDRERAAKLAEAVRDPSEYLWSIREEARFNTDFESTPGDSVAYHAPCHLRSQAIGFRGRDLLRKIPGVTPRAVMECCGHDGTYAMTVEGFEPSQRYGKNAFEGMRDVEAEVWATDCPLAALQFQQHAGVKPMHPMSILARAYRPDGFPRQVVRENGD